MCMQLVPPTKSAVTQPVHIVYRTTNSAGIDIPFSTMDYEKKLKLVRRKRTKLIWLIVTIYEVW